MRGPSNNTMMAFKRGFLRSLLLSLQSSKATMSLEERKRAVKSSADVAMATARGVAGARWPQAILSSSSSSSPSRMQAKVKRCKNIVRRCCHKRRRDGNNGTSFFARTALNRSSTEVARRLVKKRTKVLRRMIPGGDLLDEISLLHEAMDYVVHLHAEVDVLRLVSKALQRSTTSGLFHAF
ncbi:hypothetical protein GUJ93_ZPchr0006g46410 [Zizania palustris]|uniref:IBH1-like N-terminal domain-containing protein n=1 Tax=Zizania palustris TaxID=103762 RepID=A0A8J5SRS3_ZIZPA|nr:hypothetical protein GUJ93_ZPchr0006g46410 [Zizania palustris]